MRQQFSPNVDGGPSDHVKHERTWRARRDVDVETNIQLSFIWHAHDDGVGTQITMSMLIAEGGLHSHSYL